MAITKAQMKSSIEGLIDSTLPSLQDYTVKVSNATGAAVTLEEKINQASGMIEIEVGIPAILTNAYLEESPLFVSEVENYSQEEHDEGDVELFIEDLIALINNTGGLAATPPPPPPPSTPPPTSIATRNAFDDAIAMLSGVDAGLRTVIRELKLTAQATKSGMKQKYQRLEALSGALDDFIAALKGADVGTKQIAYDKLKSAYRAVIRTQRGTSVGESREGKKFNKFAARLSPYLSNQSVGAAARRRGINKLRGMNKAIELVLDELVTNYPARI